MALFDKLKGIAKDVSKTVTAVAKSAAQEFSEKPNTTPARAPVVELELLDETTLEYTWCDEFELEEIEYRPGEYEIVEYIGFGSVPVNVEIPGVIDGKNIVRLAEKFFKDNKEIRYVKLGDGIREIAKDTFCNSGIRGVILPETIEKVGACAFQGSDIMRISLPDSVTFLGRKCFQNCQHLQFVKLPKGKTILPDFLFDGCRKLLTPDTVVLPDRIERVGYYAYVPCTKIPATLEWLSFCGLRDERENIEEFRIPEQLCAIGKDSLKYFKCRKLVVPAGIGILNPKETEYNQHSEDDECIDDEEEIAATINSYISFENSDYEEVIFEPGSTYSLYKTFDKCKNLVKVYIPESIVDIEDLFGTTEKLEAGYTIKGEAIKDQYGRQVYDWDGTAMKTKDQHLSYTSIMSNRPANPALTIYCVAGSAAHKYAKENDIACAKWDI